jgi:3-oxoacyl-[acyl-carrier protein] reductase
MDLGLTGRAVVITGASSGIGLACAELLAAEGCRLVLQGRGGVDRLREWIATRGLASRAIAVAADVADEAAVEALFAAGAARFGALHGCVASAGIWPPEARALMDDTPARIREVLDVDLLGAVWTARAFQRQVAARGTRASSLVLIGSTAGRFGEAGHAAYAVAKAGLRGLMLSFKNEIVRIDSDGRVNLVEPGWTLSPMTGEALQDDAAVAGVVRTMALRRIAVARDIAAACAFLLSPLVAAHASGQTLTLAGGMEGRLLWRRDEIDPAAIRARLSGEGDGP